MEKQLVSHMREFVGHMQVRLSNSIKDNKTGVEKIAASFGITDRTLVKELTELAIVNRARILAHSAAFPTPRERFGRIVSLYNNQVNLSFRTSQSMLLQQYSTPAPIGYLAGLYVGADRPENTLFEPSAGNGLLTIAATPQQCTVNEIDRVRRMNLETQGYAGVTGMDATLPFKGFEKQFDCVVTNPPFGSTDEVVFGTYKLKSLEQVMAIRALDCMKDSGRAAIIIGGHSTWDDKGRLQAGKNRLFFNYLYSHYHVEDVLNIDSKKLYTRQGTGFAVRLILINGRKPVPQGVSPLKSGHDTLVRTFDELYERVTQYLEAPQPTQHTSNHSKRLKMLSLKARAVKLKLQLLDLGGLGMPYTPTSNACFVLDTHVPDMMAHETFSALGKIKEAVGGDIDAFVQHRLGYASNTEMCKALAAEQIDAVAMALYNIEARGQGMIIGDQTGIGKGRQAAAIIRYAALQGKVPVFITEKPNLFSDLYRDLVAIGSKDLVPFVVNSRDKKTKIKDARGKVVYEPMPEKQLRDTIKSKRMPQGFHYALATYSQFSSPERSPAKPDWLRQVAKDNIIIMDESHNASGESNTGNFLQDVVASAAGVLFLSATYAKRSDNLPLYAMKTAMSDANLSKEGLVEAIQAGGVALQEILSSQLVQEGQMIRRERSFEGIEVNYITLDKTAGDPSLDKEQEHKAVADNMTEIMREIIGFQELHVEPSIEEMDKIAAAESKEIKKRGGTSAAGVDNSPYFSKIFQVINQMLFSIKADTVAERAIQRLREGKKPVIAFASTMGSFIEQMEDEAGSPVGNGSLIDIDFATVLQRGLDGVMRYTETNHDGSKEKKQIEVSDLSPEGQEKYFQISERIRQASSGITISPIDAVKQRIEAAGYSVAEVTGRKYEVQLNHKTGKGLVTLREKLATNDAFRSFNDNEVDVLMINQSGSTGASAHAVPTDVVPVSEVKQRVMLILQAELDINTEVQKRGRINRTGQLKHIPPIYDYVISAIPAEKRLMMMLQKKLKSLDANTSSNQKQSEAVLSVPDFLNKYGDTVVNKYLIDNLDLNQRLGDPLGIGKDEDAKPTDSRGAAISIAHKVSGRVAVLPTADQQAFYEDITEAYDDYIEELKRKDEYDLEVEAMDLEAETISSQIAKVGKGGTSVFSENTMLETIRAKVLKKPFTKPEVHNLLQDSLGGKTAAEQTAELVAEFKQYMLESANAETEEKNRHYADLVAKLPSDKKIAKLPPAEQLMAIQERRNVLEEARKAAVKKIGDTANNRYRFLHGIFEFFTVGRGIYYSIGREELAKGIFLGFKIDRKKKNPFAPSNVRLRFAVAHSTKYLEIPASQHEAIGAIRGSSYSISRYERDSMIEYWDSAIRDSSQDSKIRYVVTGNLLQAFDQFKGKLVSYTLKGGGEKKGILMPDYWVPQESNKSVTVPISQAAAYIRSMTVGRSLVTAKGVSILRQGQYYKIMVAGTKKSGAWFFLNSDVLRLVNRNLFEKQADKMVSELELERIDELVQWLQAKHSDSVSLPEADFKRMFQEKVDAPRPVHEWPRLLVPEIKQDSKKTKLKLLKLKAKAVKIKLLLLGLDTLKKAA
ncbi:strawberry notch-like NTP hydrolase domain-containing protein [Pontibacter russatus]|uniref:strawberry notch-like NTP hydrolase domain-containing protein n=1 Tax=Pontibacter russatus TaxID=2694929 RepID=UPI001379A9DC|nr:strawberry notch family protein [Pontibacter russatus]